MGPVQFEVFISELNDEINYLFNKLVDNIKLWEEADTQRSRTARSILIG